MKKKSFDFSGYATKNDLLCADGRIIRRDAFKDDDGRTVPLVYQHNHEDPTRVIGHALLENRSDGVYAYCSLNHTDIAQHVKECVRHRDINALSIFANKLTQNGRDVLHGNIRELSVVLTGANPGAVIEFPLLAHGEESETEAYIWNGETGLDMGPGMSLRHSSKDDDEEDEESEESEESKEDTSKETKKSSKPESEMTVQDVLDSMTDKQRKVVEYLIGKVFDDSDNDDNNEDDEEVSHADDGDETIKDVLDSMTDTQRKVAEYLIAQALAAKESAEEDEEDKEDKEDEAEEDEEEASHYYDEGEDFLMKKNVFEGENMNENNSNTLTHAEMEVIFNDAKRDGSLRKAVLEHAGEYGIEQIDYLFPDYANVDNTPGFIQRDMGWVGKVMSGVKKSPFSRVKTMFADITADQARAKGYITKRQKKTEVFTMLKRTTDPQTIYKYQKLDRDDILDITGFDVVAWMKHEMRMMLDEEIARAVLVGDGRDPDAEDHISQSHVRSIMADDELYAIHKQVVTVQGEERAKTIIKTLRKSWKDYQGTGNCTAFMREDILSDLMLLEDGIGHFLYPTKEVVASVLGVKDIVTVPVMADASTYRTDTTTHLSYAPLMIVVNLADYNVGADKGGSVNMFEDFELKFNTNEYLIETRCSGALIRPKSAIVLEESYTPEDEDDEGGDDTHD